MPMIRSLPREAQQGDPEDMVKTIRAFHLRDQRLDNARSSVAWDDHEAALEWLNSAREAHRIGMGLLRRMSKGYDTQDQEAPPEGC